MLRKAFIHTRIRPQRLLVAVLLATVMAFAGCANSAIEATTTDPELPGEWARDGDDGLVEQNWLESFDSPQLNALVGEAIDRAQELARRGAATGLDGRRPGIRLLERAKHITSTASTTSSTGNESTTIEK